MGETKYLDELIEWLKELKPESPVDLQTLTAGRCIAEVLHIIDPTYFDASFAEKAAYDGTQWRLKANNLRKIVRRLSEFYRERLSVTLAGDWDVDVNRIAEHEDPSNLCQLLKLVFGSAVLGTNSDYFVKRLLSQSKVVQDAAMSIAKEVQLLLPPSYAPGDCTPTTPSRESSFVDSVQFASLSTKVAELEKDNEILAAEVSEHAEEKQRLLADVERLHAKLDELTEGSAETESLRKQLRAAQNLRETLQDTLYKVEAERNHLKEAQEQLAEENKELKAKIQNVMPLEEMYRRQNDELEEYRLRSNEYENMKQQIDSYKSKLSEYSSQKVTMKVLEEKISSYMPCVMALEDEQRKNATLKAHIEALRLEITELSDKLKEEIRRGDKADFECKKLTERVDCAEKERDRLRQERKQLNDELLYSNGQMSSKRSASSLHDETFEVSGSPTTLQERVARLAIENERLRTSSDDSERVAVLNEEISRLAAQKAELETELRLSNQSNVALDARVKEAEGKLLLEERADSDRLVEQQSNNERLNVINAQLRAELVEARKATAAAVFERGKAAESLESVAHELDAEREKLCTYMEKARRVIDDLDAQNRAVEGGALSRHEFDSIRRDRDYFKQSLEALSESMERNRAMQEQEQRLITTHAYYMMMRMQGATGGEGSSQDALGAPDRSFLTRQRQCGNLNFSSVSFIVLIWLVLAIGIGIVLWRNSIFWTPHAARFNALPPS